MSSWTGGGEDINIKFGEDKTGGNFFYRGQKSPNNNLAVLSIAKIVEYGKTRKRM